MFRGGIQETEVVLVGLYLLFDGLILAEQTGTLVVKGVLATLGHLISAPEQSGLVS